MTDSVDWKARAEAAEAALKEAQEQRPFVWTRARPGRECHAFSFFDRGADQEWTPLYARPVPAALGDNYRDAYEGAREDLLDWKRRAHDAACALLHVLADTNGPVKFGDPVIPAAPAVAVHPVPEEWRKAVSEYIASFDAAWAETAKAMRARGVNSVVVSGADATHLENLQKLRALLQSAPQAEEFRSSGEDSGV